jgi:hypothetical protein
MQTSREVKLPLAQVHPFSIVHEDEHPSPLILSPSSQSSVPIRFPSPHIREQLSGVEEVPPEQINPVSFSQVLLHPSPNTVFPSSQ